MATAAVIDVMLKANTASYRAAMLQAGRTTNTTLAGIRKDFESTGRSVQMLTRLTAGYLSFQGIRAAVTRLSNVADQYSNIQAKLKLVTGDQAQLGRTMDQVYGISQRTYTSLDATATLVARTTRALISSGTAADKALGRSLRLSEAINNAFLVSGATSTEAQNAIIQLSQGLAAGALRGEEFNSVAEQGSRITQALGEYLGVSTGELRKMAKDGKLTADVVSGALLSSFEKLRAEADQMPLTIARARTQLDNAFTRYVGEADQAYGSSRKVAEGIQFVARNLDPLVGGFIMAAKVGAAYFAVYRIGIPLVTAAIALQRKLTQEIIATSIAQELGIKTATSWATRMKAAIGLALSAFAGWQLGSYLRDQFLEVEIAGIALASGLLQAWEKIKGGTRVVWAGIKALALGSINTIRGGIADMVDSFASAADALDVLGLNSGAIKRVRELGDSIRGSGDAWGDFKRESAQAVTDTAAAVAQIDREFAALAEAATLARRQGEDLTTTFEDMENSLPDFSPVTKGAKDAADQLQRLLEARAAFQRESDRMKAEFEGPSAVAWLEYTTAVQDAARAVGRGEATVAQFIEREGLLARQLRETNEEIAARKTPMEQLLADLEFEQKLMAMGNAERAAAIQLRGMEAEEIRKYGQAVLDANQKILEQQELIQQTDQFRQSMVDTFSSILDGTKSVKEAFTDLADSIIAQIARMIAQQWVDQLFGKQGQAGGGMAGDGLSAFLGSFLGFDQGGYTGPGAKLQPAGVVHKGEVVWSQVDVARAGGVAVVEAMRRGLRGYADGGWANGSAAVAVGQSPDQSRHPAARRGLSIGKIEMVTKGATSARSIERQRVDLRRELDKATREFG